MSVLVEHDFYFIKDRFWRICILDAYNAIITLDMYEYIINNRIESYMFVPPKDKIWEFYMLEQVASARIEHHGNTYDVTMKIVEDIIQLGYAEWRHFYETYVLDYEINLGNYF
jgi:hypothetical protein